MEPKSIGEKWTEAGICMEEAKECGWWLQIRGDSVYFQKVDILRGPGDLTGRKSVQEHGCPDAIIAAFKEIP